MEILLIIILVVLIVGLFLIYTKKTVNKDESSAQIISILQNQINELLKQQSQISKDLGEKINEQNKTLNEQLGKSQTSLVQQFAISQKSVRETSEAANKIIKEVTEKLTKLEETNKQVVGFAGQLKSLENILKNPKQRGILGEYFLEATLKNVLPPNSYKMQHKFSNGEIVDAVILLKDKIIPVDSKFSLENYNKILDSNDPIQKEELEKVFKNDLKNRIDETSKYIRPSEGTLDFAFMFIPSEGIYYDLLINKVGNIQINTRDLINYAFIEKNVIIVSPTSFLAYLQTVLQGLRALQIEESAKQIRENVVKLGNHLKAYHEYFEKVGKNLGTTVTSYNSALKEFKKIDKDVLKIADQSMEIVSEELEKPNELS